MVRADNPGPFTLSGTNTWVVGRDPCWVVDPGPALDAHVDAVAAEAERRGGAGGIVLTHGHPDHAEAVPALCARTGAVGRRRARRRDGAARSPPSPRPATRPTTWPTWRAAWPSPATPSSARGRCSSSARSAAYLAALERLRAMGLALLCPGHGPVVEDPGAKLGDYIAHRLERERRLLDALAAGGRTVDELLDAAWDDAPAALRGAAAVTLGAHLDKLADEGRLPAGVERPQVPAALSGP